MVKNSVDIDHDDHDEHDDHDDHDVRVLDASCNLARSSSADCRRSSETSESQCLDLFFLGLQPLRLASNVSGFSGEVGEIGEIGEVGDLEEVGVVGVEGVV